MSQRASCSWGRRGQSADSLPRGTAPPVRQSNGQSCSNGSSMRSQWRPRLRSGSGLPGNYTTSCRTPSASLQYRPKLSGAVSPLTRIARATTCSWRSPWLAKPMRSCGGFSASCDPPMTACCWRLNRDLTNSSNSSGTFAQRVSMSNWEVLSTAKILTPGLSLAAYRRRGASPSLKHAAATSVTVRVDREGDSHYICLDDDGRGITRSSGGHGLRGIRERAELYGGTLDVAQSSRGGVRIAARLPIGASP